MVRIAATAVLATLFACGSAGLVTRADPSTPDPGSGRYSFSRTDEGYLRLDSRTGQVALCSRRTIGWACLLVPDERTAMEGEIARLQDEVARLKTALENKPISTPSPSPAAPTQPAPPVAQGHQGPELQGPGPNAGRAPSRLQLPSDEDLDRVMAFMEKVWRRLVDMMGNLQKDPRRT
jgi:hypothetical protein